MPGVSPELGSTVSGVNPSQLQPRLRRALGSSAEGSRGVRLGSSVSVPRDSNVNGVAESCDYFAFALSRCRAVKMRLAGSRGAGPLR